VVTTSGSASSSFFGGAEGAFSSLPFGRGSLFPRRPVILTMIAWKDELSEDGVEVKPSLASCFSALASPFFLMRSLSLALVAVK
jgi:hypothetical protein